MLDVLGLGEKQSSPMSTRVLVTRSPFTLSESKPSVFFGRACGDSGQFIFLWMAWGITHRSIGRERVDKNIVEGDIVGAHEEVRPAG